MSNLPKIQSNKYASLAPKLEELTTRECTLPELQAAIVHLIKLHNGMNEALNEMISEGRIMSKKEVSMNATYGL